MTTNETVRKVNDRLSNRFTAKQISQRIASIFPKEPEQIDWQKVNSANTRTIRLVKRFSYMKDEIWSCLHKLVSDEFIMIFDLDAAFGKRAAWIDISEFDEKKHKQVIVNIENF